MTKNFTSVTLWHKIYLGLNKILLEATTHPNNKLWWYWRLLFFHVFYFSRFIVFFYLNSNSCIKIIGFWIKIVLDARYWLSFPEECQSIRQRIKLNGVQTPCRIAKWAVLSARNSFWSSIFTYDHYCWRNVKCFPCLPSLM